MASPRLWWFAPQGHYLMQQTALRARRPPSAGFASFFHKAKTGCGPRSQRVPRLGISGFAAERDAVVVAVVLADTNVFEAGVFEQFAHGVALSEAMFEDQPTA